MPASGPIYPSRNAYCESHDQQLARCPWVLYRGGRGATASPCTVTWAALPTTPFERSYQHLPRVLINTFQESYQQLVRLPSCRRHFKIGSHNQPPKGVRGFASPGEHSLINNKRRSRLLMCPFPTPPSTISQQIDHFHSVFTTSTWTAIVCQEWNPPPRLPHMIRRRLKSLSAMSRSRPLARQ